MAYRTLLPPNATQGELAQERVHAHVQDEPIDVRTVKNPDLCPVELLPWLAWEFGVRFWDDDWSEDDKREVIKSAPKVNKTRGTVGAVKRALAATGINIDVIEWFRDVPPAPPYTFRLRINNDVSDEEMLNILEQVEDAKNERSQLSEIKIKPPRIEGEFFVGGAITGTVAVYMGQI
jgi:phage tail P2-like protein